MNMSTKKHKSMALFISRNEAEFRDSESKETWRGTNTQLKMAKNIISRSHFDLKLSF